MKQHFLLDAGLLILQKELIKEKKEKNMIIQHYQINNQKNYPKGNYYTFHFKDFLLYKDSKTLEKTFQKTLRKILTKYHQDSSILIVGLGSSSILGDSFGKKVIDELILSNSYNDFLKTPKIALFSPETISKTGISSFDLISLVVKKIKPDVIILIDSLLTKEESYLDLSLEINDCGMIYQDQLRANKMITKETFQVPILSIGYPTLLKTNENIVSKYSLKQDIDIMASLIAESIKKIILS